MPGRHSVKQTMPQKWVPRAMSLWQKIADDPSSESLSSELNVKVKYIGLTLRLLENLLRLLCEFLLWMVGVRPGGFVPLGLDNSLDLQQVVHQFICKQTVSVHNSADLQFYSLCSSSRPQSLILLASCWAFFFSLQARLASLFFSFLDLVLLWKENKFPANIINVSRLFNIECQILNICYKLIIRYYLVGKGTSLTGVMELISLPSFSSSFPILANLAGLAVRSLPSPLLALPLK